MALTKKLILELLQRVKGIGPKLSAKIWSEFKTQTPQAIAADPSAVAKAVSGVSISKANAAREVFQAYFISLGDTAEAELYAVDEPVATAAAPAPVEIDSATDVGLLDKDRVREALGEKWDDTYEARLRAEEVLERNYLKLMKLPNVCGVHVGFRRRGNTGESRITDELEVCIRFHVTKKMRSDSPAFLDPRLAVLIPSDVEGIPTDVFERTYVTLDAPDITEAPDAAAGPTGESTEKYEEELLGGIEISPKDFPTNAGTLGGVVFSNMKSRLITNKHVAGGIDSLVQQPASGATLNGKLPVIGKVVAAEMPGRGEIGSIDCALIEPNRDRDVRKKIKDLGPPFRFASGVLTQPDVHRTKATKVGAFTGRTTGIVKSVNTVVEVNGATMPRQIVVESEDNSVIIEAGDSGSLLVVKAGSETDDDAIFNIVGLVHARSEDGTAIVATHFHEIETRFGVKATRF